MSEGNPWKREVGDVSQNNFVNPNYYEISKLKEREQTAVHVKSSLQVINLDNIQAKLEAHRSSMKPIEQQYNMVKGKSSIRPESKERLKFNVDVEKEYKNIRPQQVYELIKEKQE